MRSGRRAGRGKRAAEKHAERAGQARAAGGCAGQAAPGRCAPAAVAAPFAAGRLTGTCLNMSLDGLAPSSQQSVKVIAEDMLCLRKTSTHAMMETMDMRSLTHLRLSSGKQGARVAIRAQSCCAGVCVAAACGF